MDAMDGRWDQGTTRAGPQKWTGAHKRQPGSDDGCNPLQAQHTVHSKRQSARQTVPAGGKVSPPRDSQLARTGLGCDGRTRSAAGKASLVHRRMAWMGGMALQDGAAGAVVGCRSLEGRPS
jgi:hypothetical protein